MMTENDCTQLIQEASVAYRELRLDEAVEKYEQANQLCPDSYRAAIGLARTLTRRRQYDRARDVALRAVELDPQRAEGHSMLGVLHFLVDELDDAQAELESAIELNSKDPEPRLTLSQVYADLKRFDDARGELDLARELIVGIELKQVRMELLAMAAHVETYLQLARGKRPEAIEAAQEAISMTEYNPYAASLAYANLGMVEAKARHYQQAIEYLEAAFELNPAFELTGSTLGRLLILRGHPERAVEILRQVLANKSSKGGSTRYALGMALQHAGQRQEALEQIRVSLKEGLRFPDSAMAWLRMIWLNIVVRYILVGVILAAILAWIVLTRPSPTSLTLLILAVLLFGGQYLWGKLKKK